MYLACRDFIRKSGRGIKYLNNILEQDHRFIKKIIKHTLDFKVFHSASATIAQYSKSLRTSQHNYVQK